MAVAIQWLVDRDDASGFVRENGMQETKSDDERAEPRLRSNNGAGPFDGEEYVQWAYRLLLGREPESPESVRGNPFKNDRQRLIQFVLNSAEFQTKHKGVFAEPSNNPYFSWSKDAIAFIHLPKTGGTTLHTLLQACLPEDRICPQRSEALYQYSASDLSRYELFSGHFDYFTLRFIPRERICCFSMLRDPRQRLISAYRYSRLYPATDEFGDDINVKLANKLSVEEFFEHESVRYSTWMNNAYLFVFGSSLYDYEMLNTLFDMPVTSQVSALDDQPTAVDALADNDVVAKALARATQRILGLDAIGLTERFEESIESIFGTLGFPIPQSIVPAMVTDELPNSNARLSRVPAVPMTPRLSRALERLTRYDQVIYDVARHEFERRRAASLPTVLNATGAEDLRDWRQQCYKRRDMPDMSDDKERARSQVRDNSATAPFDGGEYVRWAYRLLLGREPETPETIQKNPFKNDRKRLVQAVLSSSEFQRSNPLIWPFSGNNNHLSAEFDINKLRYREKRWDNISELRRWTKAIPVGNGTILCRTLGKYKHYVSESDIGLSPYIILDGFFEYAITEFVVRNVSPGMTVIDLGANYGYYTILMADLVGDIGKVYAFEPNPAALAAIGRSLRVNNFDRRVSLDRRAIWNCSNERVTFHIPEVAATNARIVWPLDSRLPPSDAGTPDAGSATIETIALDDLPLSGVSFVKADIEGAEERLWQGGRRFFERNPDVIFLLEFNCLRCQDPHQTLEEMNQAFSLRYLDDESKVRPVKIEDISATAHDWMLVLSRREQID
jgi:FkbM family methyltransferase